VNVKEKYLRTNEVVETLLLTDEGTLSVPSEDLGIIGEGVESPPDALAQVICGAGGKIGTTHGMVEQGVS
jgi:hypothetical protein